MNNDQIHSALNWRYATKKYDSTRKISESDWNTLEASLTLAPSSYGLQPFKFLVIDTPALRTQLQDAAYGQTQVTEAAKLVVLLSREEVKLLLEIAFGIRTPEGELLRSNALRAEPLFVEVSDPSQTGLFESVGE